MTNGQPCGRVDGHKGHHVSPEARARAREAKNNRYATDPEFRARAIESASAAQARASHRERQNARYANDDEYREALLAKKRAAWTPASPRVCPYDDPACTGAHSTRVPKAGMCPSAWARLLARGRAWNAAHPEAVSNESTREYHRQAYAADPEKWLERSRAWRAANPEKRKAQARRSERKRRELKADALIEWLPVDPEASRCYVCGRPFGPRRKRHLDHIVPLNVANWIAFKTGVLYSGLRPACHSCNTSKHDTEHSVFILGRFARGLPVRQGAG